MRKAINYDVGIAVSPDWPSRPDFDPATVRRELRIIHDDLGCEAVRIFGEDPHRLRVAGEYAVAAGLQVWLSPDLANAGQSAWLEHLSTCARIARDLGAGDTVFVLGRELTFFQHGLVHGKDPFARMRTFTSIPRLLGNLVLKGSWNRNLNRFLAKAREVVRAEFGGPLTYASGVWEKVDWSDLDIVSVDLYRDASNEADFPARLAPYLDHGKPVAITEFGCCTYRGAANKGATGWAVIDRSARPRRLKEPLERDEAEQACYLTELLDVFAAGNVDTAFAFSFASYSYLYDEDPMLDLDRAAYGIVRCLPSDSGTTYPGLAWEPKEGFAAFGRWGR